MDAEELPFISSSPLLDTAQKPVKTQDEVDLPTLKQVQKILEERIASYSSIDRLTVEEKDLTVQQQLAVSKAIVAHLTELKVLVDETITRVKEKYE